MTQFNIGIKVSKEGYDVRNATPINLITSSQFNNIKIIEEGTFSISVGAADTTKSHTITHNLGYVPGFMGFAQLSGSASQSYPIGGKDLLSGSGESFTAEADTTTVVFTVDGTGSAYTAYIYYYIFADIGK